MSDKDYKAWADERAFIGYVIYPERPIEHHCAAWEISEKELQQIVKRGTKRHRAALPGGVADALQQGERPGGIVALYFPALSEEGEVVSHKQPYPVRFAIPGRPYKQRLFQHQAFMLNDGSAEIPTANEKLSASFAGLHQTMGTDLLKVGQLIHEVQRHHYQRFSTANVLSTIGRKWSKVKSNVSMLRQTATFLEGLERIKLEHPAATAAFQAIQPTPKAVREYMRLKIIELMLDDILDDMGEDVRILSEFSDTRRWLLNRLLSTELLSIENLEKMQSKTQDVKAERVNLGWGECIGKMFEIIRPHTVSDGSAYKLIKANLEANFPSVPFNVDSIRQAVKRHQKENMTAL